MRIFKFFILLLSTSVLFTACTSSPSINNNETTELHATSSEIVETTEEITVTDSIDYSINYGGNGIDLINDSLKEKEKWKIIKKEDYSCGLALVLVQENDRGFYTYVNENDEFVMDRIFMDANSFNEDGYAIVCSKYNSSSHMIYEIINTKGETIFDNNLYNIKFFKDDNIIYGSKVTAFTVVFLYDYTTFKLIYYRADGANVIPINDDKIFYNNKWALVGGYAYPDKYGVIDRNFQEILSVEYKNIEFKEDGIYADGVLYPY